MDILSGENHSFDIRVSPGTDVPGRLGLACPAVAVASCRTIGKKDMVRNDATPDLHVDPETYEVRADGELLTCEPAETLPLAQRYFLF